MGQSFGVEPEEVRVVCYQNAPGGGGERELRRIVNADQTRLDRSRNVDAAATQAGGYAGRNVLVQVEANRHRSGW